MKSRLRLWGSYRRSWTAPADESAHMKDGAIQLNLALKIGQSGPKPGKFWRFRLKDNYESFHQNPASEWFGVHLWAVLHGPGIGIGL